MTRLRLLFVALAVSLVPAQSASAIVGGKDVPNGKYPYVAYVNVNVLFSCTGTLVDPTHVITAGHCSSITGPAAATPIATDPRLIDVWLNSNKAHDFQGTEATVTKVDVHPDYVFTNNQSGNPLDSSGHDVAILTLAEPVNLPTVKVVGKGEEALFSPGTMSTIAGFGEDGNGNIPDVMQEAQVPIATDAAATAAYGDSYEKETMLPAGYDKGGVDTCQGDSGGPIMAPTSTGVLRLTGDTSWGVGCAEPHTPGIYGRLGAPVMRDWIKSIAPGAVAPDATTTTAAAKRKKPAAKRRKTRRHKTAAGRRLAKRTSLSR